MRRKLLHTGLIICLTWPHIINAQIDSIRNIQPVLSQVSVQPATGFVEMHWNYIPSTYVAGFVLFHYDYVYQGAMIFKTLWNPLLLNYIDSSQFANYYSVDYQIQAIDSSGNPSKLSNRISTIFATTSINWNSYSSQPKKVNDYSILCSVNGSAFSEAGKVNATENSYSLLTFTSDADYCFIVRANLEGGLFSTSNKVCLSARMQRPPEWINADQATVNDDNTISLSYTIDPQSEIRSFGLDRRKDTENDFSRLAAIQSAGNKVTYSDMTAVPGQKYIYRLGAINNCGNPVVLSDVSVNMDLTLSADEGSVTLRWNKYREWEGNVDHYKVFINTGSGFTEKAILQPGDTTLTVDYADFMYDISSGSYCFRVEAYEGTNPHGIAGLSRSNQACREIQEVITVPNAFTPDNDNINDRFRPVLSFTPSEYRLIIADRKNNRLFETTSYQADWDGTKNGSPLSPDVYLWFLKVKTPSGKYVTRTGTVTIIKNR
jgi:gliding motility-associated-like protein